MMDILSLSAVERLQLMGFPARTLVLVASSMGGTNALYEMLPGFGDLKGIGMVIVQHMQKGFSEQFAERLNNVTDFKVVEAKNGDMINGGKAYIAPGGLHLVIEKANMGWYKLGTEDGPHVRGVKPAADVLFRSSAQAVDIPIISIVLTGMGSDGADGVEELKKRGCYVITQSKETCNVYGMPRAVDMRGLSDLSLPLSRIPRAVLKAPRIARRRHPGKIGQFRIKGLGS
ncbi:MAG: CheB methylesterase domain-containing protein [Candidatus Thermoplasmatota archaeon]|nr:CheB methylesterase domain-containing protein [Candidatus Thermoplasmatota archaeon]